MLDIIGDLVKNLIVLVILASFVELILPGNKFQPYIKLAAGIMILISILNPLLQLFSLVPDLEKEIKQMGSFNLEGYNYDREEGLEFYQESILNEYEWRLQKQVKEIVEKHSLELVSFQAEVAEDVEEENFGEIMKIEITLAPPSPGELPGRVPVIIEEVEVQIGKEEEEVERRETESKNCSPQKEKIREELMDLFSLTEQQVKLFMVE